MPKLAYFIGAQKVHKDKFFNQPHPKKIVKIGTFFVFLKKKLYDQIQFSNNIDGPDRL